MIENRQKPTNVLLYLGLLISVFVLGMLLLVGLRLAFESVNDRLSSLASNEKVRQAIGNHIATEINEMESTYFQLAPVSGLYELNINVNQLHQHLTSIRRDIEILEQGGVFESKTLLNTPQLDSLTTQLTYKPDPGERYILAAIELKPQLPELEKRIDGLVTLLEERTRLRRENDSEGYFRQIKMIQTHLRRTIPLFQRLRETANNLLYESGRRLEKLELVINSKKREYRIIEGALYIALIILASVLGALIAYKIRDIVRKEQASDEELRNAGKFLNTIMESITHPFCVIDLKTFSIEISNPAAKAEALDPSKTKCHEYFFNRDKPCDPNECGCVLDEVKRTGKAVSFVETRSHGNDTKFIEHRAYPVFDNDGQIVKLIEYWTDVSDLKKMEQERMMLAAAVEQSAESIVIASRSGNIHYVNPAFESSSGYEKHEARGRNFLGITSNDTDNGFYRQIWETVIQGISWKGRLTSKKKDGTLYEESAVISPILDENGLITNFVAVKRDVTAEVELEKQIRHAQKMEAVGTLAGGIAHDFNNLLQIILSYSDMLLADDSRAASEVRKLAAIRHAASNGAELVKQLLAFGRKSPVVLKPVDLNAEVQRIADLLFRTIPKMIEIKLNLHSGLHIVEVDSAHFEQVILNLATNARDAMPEGGMLLLETRNVIVDDKFCDKHPELKPGKYVLLTVSDSGSGMEKHVVSRIFEPFFSTKESGKGTGLGLSTAFGIVHAHKGHIVCESQIGFGTSFSIYLPASQTLPETDQTVVITTSFLGSETILVVEDDHQMQELLVELLESVGYEIITARNGVEALEVYRNKRDDISLIILDLIMPQMGGKQCLEALMKLNPHVRVIVASGYSDDGPISEVLEMGARAFINKPFDGRQMLKIIREVLDEV